MGRQPGVGGGADTERWTAQGNVQGKEGGRGEETHPGRRKGDANISIGYWVGGTSIRERGETQAKSLRREEPNGKRKEASNKGHHQKNRKEELKRKKNWGRAPTQHQTPPTNPHPQPGKWGSKRGRTRGVQNRGGEGPKKG